MELFKAHPTHISAVVDPAEYFVYFTYSRAFDIILNAVDNVSAEETGAEDLFAWISITSVNRHFGRMQKERFSAPVVYPKGWAKDAFQQCIASIPKVLFVMSPLAKPVALERLWFIYDVYLEILEEKCSLAVILSEDDEQYLIENLLVSSQSILDYINKVRAEKAKASNPEQDKRLRLQIERLPGGYVAIDESIRDRLRDWFAHAARQYIQDVNSIFKINLAESGNMHVRNRWFIYIRES